MSVEAQLSRSIDRRGPDECWPFTGRSVTKQGYGRIKVGGRKGRVLKAHRVAWEVASGPIPDGPGPHGTCVLHSCDNPPCCNPAHLFLGTQKDNMEDSAQKQRTHIGEVNPRAKLTEDDVREIRLRARLGEVQRTIADDFGIAQTAVSLIVRRERWAHVA